MVVDLLCSTLYKFSLTTCTAYFSIHFVYQPVKELIIVIHTKTSASHVQGKSFLLCSDCVRVCVLTLILSVFCK